MKKGIIHGKLNSNHVIFEKRPSDTDEMKSTICKISSFSDQNHSKSTLTYIAPEILSIYVPSNKSDVYSAGVIFWEMLTLEICHFHTSRKTLSISDEWPDSVKDILNRCLNIEASKRPNFSEIVNFLEDIHEKFPHNIQENKQLRKF